MAYREFPARPELADLVAGTWQRDVPRAGATRVLPDACVDLVWQAGELFIAGPDRTVFMSPVGPGAAIVGLRLRTGTAGAVLGLPARELQDLRVPLDAVWGRAGAVLADRVTAAGHPAARRQLLETAILERRDEMADLDAVVLAARRRLGRPGTRVSSLSRVVATSERQLLRRFDAAVGYGPKTLDRILRFQRLVARAPEQGLARVATELGYADQAHLNRECVKLSGLTPIQLMPSADVEHVA